MLRNHGESLNDESLCTLMVEVERIINYQPITFEYIGDVNSFIPNARVVMPPPGTFQKKDMYCRKQWQHVQHFSNEFWIRWRKEVFATLQTRQKWNQTKRNFEVGDIVLVRDDVIRNKWPMARILKTCNDKEGLAQGVQLVTGRTNSSDKETSIFDRLLNKLVLLVENENENVQEYWSIS